MKTVDLVDATSPENVPLHDFRFTSGAHQMEPASPIQALEVNPFPSGFINRTIRWGGFAERLKSQ